MGGKSDSPEQNRKTWAIVIQEILIGGSYLDDPRPNIFTPVANPYFPMSPSIPDQYIPRDLEDFDPETQKAGCFLYRLPTTRPK